VATDYITGVKTVSTHCVIQEILPNSEYLDYLPSRSVLHLGRNNCAYSYTGKYQLLIDSAI